MQKLREWSIFALVCAAAYFFLAPPLVGGSTSYVIVDGTSMEPTYYDGDLIIARERDNYEVDDVITYTPQIGQHFPVIHRIVEFTDEGIITIGDNRDEVDGWKVQDEDIIGASVLRIPMSGTVLEWLRNPFVIIALGTFFIVLYLLKDDDKDNEKTQKEEVLA